MTPAFRRASGGDFAALQQLLELYQYDLSDIWHQEVDAEAKYGYDLAHYQQSARFHAYLALMGSQPIGFALVAPACVTRADGCWMEQFFILKRFRRNGLGKAFARYVLNSHPGAWEIGQMQANEAAHAFWRNVVYDVTDGQFTETQVTEGWWKGIVQQLNVEHLQ